MALQTQTFKQLDSRDEIFSKKNIPVHDGNIALGEVS